MYLLLLGIIAVGAGILLIYYSMRDKKGKKDEAGIWETKDEADEKGKVIYLFDEEEDNSGFVDPKPDKPTIDNDKTPKGDDPEGSDKKDD